MTYADAYLPAVVVVYVCVCVCVCAVVVAECAS